jgi:hypothetical protein
VSFLWHIARTVGGRTEYTPVLVLAWHETTATVVARFESYPTGTPFLVKLGELRIGEPPADDVGVPA